MERKPPLGAGYRQPGALSSTSIQYAAGTCVSGGLSTGHLCIWGWPWGHRTRRASESEGIRGPCNATATGCVPDRISPEESQQQSGKSFSNPPLRGSSPSFLLPPPSLPVMKRLILLSLITSCEAWYDHWQVTT